MLTEKRYSNMPFPHGNKPVCLHACSIFTVILCYRTTARGQEVEDDGCLARLTRSLSHLLH